ncbi:MAG: hypothetical protein V1809_16475, partial [Planctomycetota bacterium]
MTILLILGLLGSFATGHYLGKRGRAAAVAGVILGFAGVCVRLVFHYYPDIEWRWFPWEAYADVRGAWWLGFSFLILGAGRWLMTNPRNRRAVTGLVAVLGVWGVFTVVAGAVYDPSGLTGAPGRVGNCYQTSDWSCGAAAAATLVSREGVNAAEAEMARFCGSNPWQGTDEFMILRGLRRKLAGTGLRPILIRTDLKGLRSLGRPAMAVVRHTWFVDHWVVV